MHRNEKVHFRAKHDKNTDYIKKWFKQKLQGIKFPTKHSAASGVELGGSKNLHF